MSPRASLGRHIFMVITDETLPLVNLFMLNIGEIRSKSLVE
jgi:hypothetical protein